MNTLKGLYAIADVQCIGSTQFIEKVNDVLAAGVKIIQYRDKTSSDEKKFTLASEVKSLTVKHHALLIINDDVHLTKSIDADGVHLGKDDDLILDAREKLGVNKIIGASCYNDFENAIKAVDSGANYVAFGSLFSSQSKPNAPRADLNLLIRAKKELEIPVCAIGGINKTNLHLLLDVGVDMIAIISALFKSNSPRQTAEEFLTLMQQFDLSA